LVSYHHPFLHLYGTSITLGAFDFRVNHELEQPDYSVKKSIDYETPNEVKQIIKNFPNKKAPGHDKITNLIFKK
jgi:hypothetical protein